MLADHTIAVVIPALNEARLLPRTLSGLPRFVDIAVVIDDGSTDHTAEVARACDAACRVVVVSHAHNQGVGAAIVTGYRWCLEEGVDVAVVMGADDQMHPDDLPGLLEPLLSGDADYVTGDRLAWPGGWRRFPPVRLVGVVALAAMTRWATGLPALRDAQCGYTAVTRDALARIPLDSLYARYGFPNDMLAKVVGARLRVAHRPVRPVYGTEVSALRIHKVVGPLVRLTLANHQARLRGASAEPLPPAVRSTFAPSPTLAPRPSPPLNPSAPPPPPRLRSPRTP